MQASRFQFHYGTIKRRHPLHQTILATSFQFHYGTIKSAELAGKGINSVKFQFHYGTIKSSLISFFPFLAFFISIPLWYD